ncbi:MAG: phosphoenolpyruvate synthase, partial [Deltaproteobacteria bacterium]|nr:phosphoenolpyruvate synthase [Deltaproteobacteria bacterium]
MHCPPYRLPSIVIALLLFAAPMPASAKLPAPEVRREWIQVMKASPKGPFARIRWFCADGTVHPPKPYPCGERGGGIQHGEWNDHAVALREADYQIANVLGDLQGEAYVGDTADLEGLKQILLERFLMGFDDGWIFQQALSYRGAFQIEDELAGADRILQAIVAD